MSKQRIIGRVSGRDIAPDTFEDAFEKLFDARLANMVAGMRETGFQAVTRFGKYGMLVRLYETLDGLLVAHEKARETNEEYLAGVLVEQALVYLAMAKGYWNLPLRQEWATDDEEEEFLREH
jgi:hypothetical protein